MREYLVVYRAVGTLWNADKFTNKKKAIKYARWLAEDEVFIEVYETKKIGKISITSRK